MFLCTTSLTQIYFVYTLTLTMTSHPSSQNIKLAVDAVIFSIKDGDLQVLLIQMKKSPFTGDWAIPGGIIDDSETTIEAAERILKTQTGVSNVYLEQLMTFDDVNRDPAGRVVSVAHVALLPNTQAKLETTEKYQDVRWWPVKKLPKLAYDHKQILQVALDRLTAKIQYTNIAWSLLPLHFSLTELQAVYETILDKPLDKRNFRKRIAALDLIEPSGKKREGGAFRPAELYEFKEKTLKYVEIT